MRIYKICGKPITDWRNEGDMHPDCELMAHGICDDCREANE